MFVMNGAVNPHDITYCILASAVTDVPIVPVLSACEADQMLKPGQQVTQVGFGLPNLGHKYWVNTMISAVRYGGDEVVLGSMNAGSDNGDSGGPAYVQMPDKTWRVFGVTSRGLNGNNDATGIYTVMSRYVDWIQTDSGLNITPCHDAGGAWVGGPACTKFPTDPGGMSNGTWATGCNGGALADPAPTCSGQSADGGGGTSPDGSAGSGTDDSGTADATAGSPMPEGGDDSGPPLVDGAGMPPAPRDAQSSSSTGAMTADGAATSGPEATPPGIFPAPSNSSGCSLFLDKGISDRSHGPAALALVGSLAAFLRYRTRRRSHRPPRGAGRP
jgi:hypothetical protein